MKICVVGNGPTAQGHGAEIDACDFVVRLKAYWRDGPEDAGKQIDAWATFGCKSERKAMADNEPQRRSLECAELWLTHTPTQIQNQATRPNDGPWDRLTLINEMGSMRPIRWVAPELYDTVFKSIDCAPTTGLMAIAMGLRLFGPTELVLAGFDNTTEDKPNFHCARRNCTTDHDFAAEKRAIAELHGGQWLGQPTHTKLTWIEEPKL